MSGFKTFFFRGSLIIFGCIIGYNFGGWYSTGIFGFFSTSSGTGIVQAQDIFHSKKVQETYKYIEQNYYGFHTKNYETVEDAFLSSLVNSLGDKHSNYLNDKDAKQFISTLQGDFEGIGAVIHENPKGIQIMKVLPGSPAEKNNLIQGDIITFVDEKSMNGISADEAVKLIRGPKGSMVTLTVLSKKDTTSRNISIQRDTVNVPTVYSDMLSGSQLGYIEIAIFGENTIGEFIKGFNKLTASGAQGIIIDARNNGGGFLDTAVELCSLLLPKNTVVVSTKGNNPIENMTLFTQDTIKENTSIPIIMLVNNMSASATEITAGALQEYKRALIVGEKTYGKGSVQTPFTLSDGSIVKLTTAKWYTPNGKSIDEKGIEPNIIITLTDDDYKNGFDRQLEGAKKLLQYQISHKTSFEEMVTNSDNIIKD